MTAKPPFFSRHRRIIQNQKLIQVLAALCGIFAMSTPIFLVLLVPYMQVILSLWIVAMAVYSAGYIYERTHPLEKGTDKK